LELTVRQVGSYPLWVGTARDARDIQGVLAAGIHALVDLAAEEPPVSPTRDLVYARFPLVDGNGNEPKLLRATLGAVVSLIRQRIPTLIACGMGLSRAPAVAAVALGAVYGVAVADTLTMFGHTDVLPVLLRDLQLVVEEH
jgi:protein-tyrosine phosphatase